MVENETMKSILARRSYKVFDAKPLSDEELDTIVTAGLYAPTGMNQQPWHFVVIKSPEMMERIGEAIEKMPRPQPPKGAPKPAGGPGGPPPKGPATRNAPVLILVTAEETMTSVIDCHLAMENMSIAAASLGIMSGWDFMMVKDFFADGNNADLKKELIPEKHQVFAAAFFGYPGPEVKDRGERKGTVSYF